MMTPLQTLQKYFGYEQFRPGQEEIISSVLSSRDTLAILPTGGGKSLCFQIPGLMLSGTTIVISPLISLMKDQVSTLQARGVHASYINSTLSRHQQLQRLNNLAKGKYTFVYIAPERLTTRSFLRACHQISVSLVAIDEAHCISMWGHDFRPSYLRIAEFISFLGRKNGQRGKGIASQQAPRVAAFTATATAAVRQDIVRALNLNQPDLFLNSFRRANLRLNVIHTHTQFVRELTLFRLLNRHRHQSGIIYTSTQKQAAYISQLLQHYWGTDAPVAAYHAGLPTAERSQVQEQFLNNEIRIIAATNAFGMGVDKSNIRFVIHYQVPGNIENYYQEAGRAGRDRQLADCYLLFYPPDLAIQQQFIARTHPDPNQERHQYLMSQLNSMIGYATAEQCRQQYILNYFNEANTTNCHQCDYCCCRQFGPTDAERKIYVKLQPLSHKISPQAIQLIALHQPHTLMEFAKLPGIGQGWLNQWYNSVSRLLEK